MDWYGADPFQTLKSTISFGYKLKKKHEEMQKTMVNNNIVPAFLASVFDPSELFAVNENFSCDKSHKINVSPST